MRLNVPGIRTLWLRTAVVAIVAGGALASCSSAPPIPAAEQPLSKETLMLLGRKGMDSGAPVFIRIFKEESELEVWKQRSDGRFYHFKTYPICNWSGELGPKMEQGDKQAPEGFYDVAADRLKPDSRFHLALNLGYPNAYDRSKHRSGKFLMVHGDCKSAGCYAMTDALIEEIYALAREAIRSGQSNIAVHAYPFRMTDEKLERHKENKWYAFWKVLKHGHDYFEINRVPPTVAVCERRYVVDVVLPVNRSLDPVRACPRFKKQELAPFAPRPEEMQIAMERIKVPGPKLRRVAASTPSPASPEPSASVAASTTPASPELSASVAGLTPATEPQTASASITPPAPQLAVRNSPIASSWSSSLPPPSALGFSSQ